jgi:hypothetical protein
MFPEASTSAWAASERTASHLLDGHVVEQDVCQSALSRAYSILRDWNSTSILRVCGALSDRLPEGRDAAAAAIWLSLRRFT